MKDLLKCQRPELLQSTKDDSTTRQQGPKRERRKSSVSLTKRKLEKEKYNFIVSLIN